MCDVMPNSEMEPLFRPLMYHLIFLGFLSFWYKENHLFCHPPHAFHRHGTLLCQGMDCSYLLQPPLQQCLHFIPHNTNMSGNPTEVFFASTW